MSTRGQLGRKLARSTRRFPWSSCPYQSRVSSVRTPGLEHLITNLDRFHNRQSSVRRAWTYTMSSTGGLLDVSPVRETACPAPAGSTGFVDRRRSVEVGRAEARARGRGSRARTIPWHGIRHRNKQPQTERQRAKRPAADGCVSSSPPPSSSGGPIVTGQGRHACGTPEASSPSADRPLDSGDVPDVRNSAPASTFISL